MKVLLLSPYFTTREAAAAKTFGHDEIILHEGPPESIPDDAEFLVSFGYNYILKDHVLAQFPRKAINVHIGYLPWNKGADPNFWSWFDNTKKGVTIHYMDKGVDTGEIIFQVEVEKFRNPEMTLKTTYDELMQTGSNMLRWAWPSIKQGRCSRITQAGTGSSHRLIDKEPLMKHLPLVWDTPVQAIEELGKKHRAGS